MGNYFICPFANSSDLENGMESILVKSIDLGDNAKKTTQRSISFHGQDSKTKILKSLPSGEMVVEGSISFMRGQNETMVSVNVEDDAALSRCLSSKSMEFDEPCVRSSENMQEEASESSDFYLRSPKHEAALKLQKVYKSFRTRRKLADCAVIAEQSWWKVLDFAELKHSSISFFDIEHHETAISRWSRAKTRAAKVGKGLSKSDRAQKLALQHWLEAIDPRHRYGHNLHFYYVRWLDSQSREPFFYWLDIGEGKEVNLEKCPRWKLQQQCIKYLGPMERKPHEVTVENGKLFYLQSGEILDTASDPNAKWIFVLSTSKTLYVGKKKKGTFQHSSFLAGGATSAAGRLVVDNGILKAVWPHSGHYKPTTENFQDLISYLKENNVDLAEVKMDPVDDDEHSLSKLNSHHLRNSSEEDWVQENDHGKGGTNGTDHIDETEVVGGSVEAEEDPSNYESGRFHRFLKKLTKLHIPKKEDLVARMQSEKSVSGTGSHQEAVDIDIDCRSPTEEPLVSRCDKRVKDMSDHEERQGEIIPKESILQRINSHKEAKSYQLGRQLSCKWTSGAGPRIGCVRDYPAELQARALEQVNLSPRSRVVSKSLLSPSYMTRQSPRASTPHSLFPNPISRTHSSPLAMESNPIARTHSSPLAIESKQRDNHQ